MAGVTGAIVTTSGAPSARSGRMASSPATARIKDATSLPVHVSSFS